MPIEQELKRLRKLVRLSEAYLVTCFLVLYLPMLYLSHVLTHTVVPAVAMSILGSVLLFVLFSGIGLEWRLPGAGKLQRARVACLYRVWGRQEAGKQLKFLGFARFCTTGHVNEDGHVWHSMALDTLDAYKSLLKAGPEQWPLIVATDPHSDEGRLASRLLQSATST